MKRTILAYLEIDDDLAFEKIDDGPIAYLADPKEAYLVYLARFAFDHLGDGNIYPLPYEQWRSM